MLSLNLRYRSQHHILCRYHQCSLIVNKVPEFNPKIRLSITNNHLIRVCSAYKDLSTMSPSASFHRCQHRIIIIWCSHYNVSGCPLPTRTTHLTRPCHQRCPSCSLRTNLQLFRARGSTRSASTPTFSSFLCPASKPRMCNWPPVTPWNAWDALHSSTHTVRWKNLRVSSCGHVSSATFRIPSRSSLRRSRPRKLSAISSRLPLRRLKWPPLPWLPALRRKQREEMIRNPK